MFYRISCSSCKQFRFCGVRSGLHCANTRCANNPGSPQYANTHIQIYRKFHLQKLIRNQIKKKNIYCGYSVPTARRFMIFIIHFCAKYILWVLCLHGEAVLTSAHTLCFRAKIRKDNVHPCKPQFYYIKRGFKRVKII